jgi:hypothetical protein
MAAWPEVRAAAVQDFTTISNYVQNQMPTDVQNLTTAMAQYVQAGGVSNDPSQDPNYATIVSASQSIQANRTKMMELNSGLSAAIRSYANNNDMNGLLSENGLLQQTIQNRQKDKQDTEVDAKAAELRDELLRTREHRGSKHQLILLGRPLRPASIPYLWALSALFVGIGLLVVAMAFPTLNISNEFRETDWMETLRQPVVWGPLLGGVLFIGGAVVLNAMGVFRGTS